MVLWLSKFGKWQETGLSVGVNTQSSWLVNTWFSSVISASTMHNTDSRFIILCACVCFWQCLLIRPNLVFKNTCPYVCGCVCHPVSLAVDPPFLHISICENVCLCACMSACVCVFCWWRIYTEVSHLHQSSLVLSQSALLVKLDIITLLLCFTVHIAALPFTYVMQRTGLV